MKRFLTSRLFTFILGAVIFSGISVSAYTILANNIGYTPSDSTWKKTNGEDITNVKDAIDELYLNSNSVLKPELLWTNLNPSSNFVEQTINMDLSDYKYILITVKASTSEDYYPLTNCIIPVHESYPEYGSHVGITGGSGFRNIKVNKVGIYISNEIHGYNQTVIPYKIYGIKQDLGIDIESPE